MEIKPARSALHTPPDVQAGALSGGHEQREHLAAFLEAESETLLQQLRFYVLRLNLAQGAEARAVALDILQEVALEALTHAARFEPQRQPMAWLLGIGVNVIRRRKVEGRRRSRREVSPASIGGTRSDSPSETQIFELLQPAGFLEPGPEEEVEESEQVETLLGLVDGEDRELLRLAFVQDFEREAIARRLGISAGAARVRLHRALQRLRRAFLGQADGGRP
jgi:RNA polymerase sigma factor (sigma-70 family)